jgi:hypothetical protein
MKKNRSHVIRVYNNSRQLIQLQARPPGGNFYMNESQIRIQPGHDVLLPKAHLRQDQLENLKKKGFIKILHDSELVAERQEAMMS